MEDILAILKRRSAENWLIDYDSHEFYQLTEEFLQDFLQVLQQKKQAKILIMEKDSLRFLAAFLAGVISQAATFLANPQWSQQELEQVFELVQPDLIIGENQLSSLNFSLSSEVNFFPASIMIPTSGSSGSIRFAIHTWETLSASVQGFQQCFAVKSINSFCILPLYHVSGLMQFLRSFLTGGKLAIFSYKALKINKKPQIEVKDFFISLVPTQLQFLLQSDPIWLSHFQTVLLGGAPAWPSLLKTARKLYIQLAPTYGMTETASQIVTLKPEDFLRDNNSSGQILPHAQVTIRNQMGEVLENNQTGIITINAESLCLGYYPDIFANSNCLKTDDLGFFDGSYLHIIGRNSQKIITGGENVFPSEVEAAILSTQLVNDVCVIGLPDEKWGEVVTAIYVAEDNQISVETIKSSLADKISQFKQPKYWIQVKNLSRNQQGKIDYAMIKNLASTLL